MTWAAFAPAKVNLFLHVGPLASDGYHPIASLALFADVGDTVSAEPAKRFEVAVSGPFASGVPATADNLVARAVMALDREPPKLRLTIDKQLPVAAGLGGGSSDAAAALRLLIEAGVVEPSAPDLKRAADAIGADGPACLAAKPVVMQGKGDSLSPARDLPTLHAVLVNPRAPCPTGAVYRAYDSGPSRSADLPPAPAGFPDPAALADWLAQRTRNDLEGPAQAVQPAVRDVLAGLRAHPEPLLVRMSGSGATVFALTADAEAADTLAVAVQRARPEWWTRACRLGGGWSQAGNRPRPAA